MKLRFLLVIMLACVTMLLSPSWAQEDPVPVYDPQGEYLIEPAVPSITALVEAEYISGILHPGTQGTGTSREIPFVLKFALKEGWYMYWRTPGDSGMAPTFDWSASDNLDDVSIGWPAPKRFEQDGLYSFGYDGVVEMPVTVTIKELGKPLKFNLNTSLIVCNKICVPQTLNMMADVDQSPSLPSPYTDYFKEVKASLPAKEGKDGFRLDTAVLGKSSLIVTLYSPDGFDGTDIFVESDTVSLTAVPVMEQDPSNPLAALFRINAPEGTDNLTEQLMGKKITVTAVRNKKSVEKEFSF